MRTRNFAYLARGPLNSLMGAPWHGDFSASLALCEGNPPSTNEFPSNELIMWNFDVFFHVSPNKLSNSQTDYSGRLWMGEATKLTHLINPMMHYTDIPQYKAFRNRKVHTRAHFCYEIVHSVMCDRFVSIEFWLRWWIGPWAPFINYVI